jgi:hypothetical protein
MNYKNSKNLLAMTSMAFIAMTPMAFAESVEGTQEVLVSNSMEDHMTSDPDHTVSTQ